MMKWMESSSRPWISQKVGKSFQIEEKESLRQNCLAGINRDLEIYLLLDSLFPAGDLQEAEVAERVPERLRGSLWRSCY